MDMLVNRRLIRVERERRAWSQEHLAVVAGVGVRTVQRVESTGIASNETAKALAAVFECPLDALRAEPTPAPVSRAAQWAPRFRAVSAAVFALVTGTLLLVTSLAHAQDYKLDVALLVNCTQGTGELDCAEARTFSLVAKEGETAEAILERAFRVVLTPRPAKDGNVLLSAEIYRFDGTQYSLWAKPSVVARAGEDATINLTGGDGKAYIVAVKPTVL